MSRELSVVWGWCESRKGLEGTLLGEGAMVASGRVYNCLVSHFFQHGDDSVSKKDINGIGGVTKLWW